MSCSARDFGCSAEGLEIESQSPRLQTWHQCGRRWHPPCPYTDRLAGSLCAKQTSFRIVAQSLRETKRDCVKVCAWLLCVGGTGRYEKKSTVSWIGTMNLVLQTFLLSNSVELRTDQILWVSRSEKRVHFANKKLCYTIKTTLPHMAIFEL